MRHPATTTRGVDNLMAPERAQESPVFSPRVDIVESATHVVVTADMPGVDESSVGIDLVGTELTIKGDSLRELPEGYSLSYSEYQSGGYERSFTLGDSIDREHIEATVRNGVLRLVLPKATAPQPRRILVNAG